MSSFLSPLIVSPQPDGKRWMVMEDFTYDIGEKDSGNIITVEEGFLMDFASIPKFLFFLPYWSKYNKAPVLHDWLYQNHSKTRKEADKIFLEAMLVEFRKHSLGKLVAKIEYYAVRLFGWVAWRKNEMPQLSE
uniref:DUF1353 domain-containing protein n=1 Tax=viral metagenome TaxID=1070528 RepID=A0A6H2A156_9ZZZZ